MKEVVVGNFRANLITVYIKAYILQKVQYVIDIL